RRAVPHHGGRGRRQAGEGCACSGWRRRYGRHGLLTKRTAQRAGVATKERSRPAEREARKKSGRYRLLRSATKSKRRVTRAQRVSAEAETRKKSGRYRPRTSATKHQRPGTPWGAGPLRCLLVADSRSRQALPPSRTDANGFRVCE